MDELPSHAKALLELARDGHNPPDDGARLRVRGRLAVALAAPLAGSVMGSAGSGMAAGPSSGIGQGIWGSWLGTKGWVAATLVAVGIGGAALVVSNRGGQVRLPGLAGSVRQQEPVSEVVEPVWPAPAPAPQAAVQAAPVEPAAVAPIAKTSRRVARGARQALRGSSASGLSRETELLARAAQLLAQGDVAGARGLLDEHRRRFEHSQLREEREGLLVLARCIEQPVTAHTQARRFVARAPSSVLVARIEKACAVGANE